MINKTREEIAWIAGLLEGEGCFKVTKKFQIPMITIGMTDRDTIEKARSILGGNSGIHERNGLKDNHKRIYVFSVSPSRLAIEWMQLLYPFMGERRKSKISEIINIYELKPKRSDGVKCAKGHVFEEVGYFINNRGTKYCKICHREAGKIQQQKLRDKRKTVEYQLAKARDISIEEAKEIVEKLNLNPQ